jgi:hypothetical protein
MLPPGFCALAGIADNATPNPATRNIRASALERIAAFIDIPSRCVIRPVFRIMIAAVRLSGISVAGKAVRNPADETPQG